MTSYWPLSIVENGVGEKTTVLSYACQLCLVFTVAYSPVPDVRLPAGDFLLAFKELKLAALVPAMVNKPVKLAKPGKHAGTATTTSADQGKIPVLQSV